MLFRLVRPMRRKGSSQLQFNRRIPSDLRDRVAGLRLEIPSGDRTVSLKVTPTAQAVRFSLGTSVPSEVKVRTAQAEAYLETVWQALRANRPIPLTHRQAVALAGELYRSWADDRHGRSVSVTMKHDGTWEREEQRQDSPEEWAAAALSFHSRDELGEPLERLEGADLEAPLGPIVDCLLLRKGIHELDLPSRLMVLNAFLDALLDAFEVRKRQAQGDYAPDPKANRFPPWEREADPKPLPTGTVSLKGLADDWWREAEKAGRTRSTFASYKSTIDRLAAFLGHDDASVVTPADLVRFKDARLAAGISTKTVGDSDLAGLRVLFGFAVDNVRLATNPATNVRVTRSKPTRNRERSFRRDEAEAILAHSFAVTRKGESEKVWAAKRWVPWLCAYTGARVGEMVQLRKQDLRQEGKLWVVTITPEAGTVKDKEVREVVLHEHLAATGFPDFVKASPDGYLFLNPPRDGDIRGVWRGVKNRVTEFVRQVVKDPAVQPNHGWRHTFKTIGREHEVADSVLDAICGHAPGSVGGSYGGVTLDAQAKAMAKFPRFAPEPPPTAS